MKKLLFTSIICFIATSIFSQTIIHKDPQIEIMLKEVSADSLKSYISKMVSFGTRNTLSTQADPKRGIGVAKNWVLGRFNEFAKQSGGRLTAFIDTITLQPDGRSHRAAYLRVPGNISHNRTGTSSQDSAKFAVNKSLSRICNLSIAFSGLHRFY